MRSVVIPFRYGSGDSIELKYTLRSIDKYLTDVEDAYLVGMDKPIWYFGAMIDCPDDKKLPPVSKVLHKLKAACEDPRVTEDFYYFNDDTFLVGPFKDGPFFMCNPPQRSDNSVHHRGFQLTFDELDRRGVKKPWKDCELHYPVIYNKSKCLELLNAIDIKLPYSFRTLYFNLLGVQLAPANDIKTFEWKEPSPKMWVHSINDNVVGTDGFKKWAQKTYPTKSQWEA